MSYAERLNMIVLRTRLLAGRLRQKDGELAKALEEVQQLKAQIENQANIIEDLNNKIKVIKLARATGKDGDATALKRKINEYIRDIDNTIALLNNR